MKHPLLPLLIVLVSVITACDAPSGDGYAEYQRGDYAGALKIIAPLASKGEAWAQLNLGLMYFEGEGVAQDRVEAAKWYRLAASQGYAPAHYKMGFIYALGQGVAESDVHAYMWLDIGAMSGDANAVTFRNIVSTQLTPGQVAQAQKMARECLAKEFKDCE